MAAKAKKGSACPVATGLSGNDTVLVIATVASITNTYQIPATSLFSNTSVPIITVGNNALSSANLIIRTATVPAATGSNGMVGQVVWDSGFLYVCVANNLWKRATLATF